jgi:exopolysaccharide biosynthesis polyprenyl glycosylphosphotransferase
VSQLNDKQKGASVFGRDLKPAIASDSSIASTLACVVATNEVANLLRHLGSMPQVELCALYLLDDDGTQAEIVSAESGVRVYTRLHEFVTACDAHALVISNDRRLIKREVAFAIIELALKGAAVCSLAQFIAAREQALGSQAEAEGQVVQHVLEALDADSPDSRLKRFLDLVLASIALVLLAPLFCLIALAIKLDSPGPVFFVQDRLGRRRVPFRCLKFRTMCEDAEGQTGPVWARTDDPRITRVGRFLRKSRMDELPQLINVLRGEMSIVGTRPIRHYFAEQLTTLIPFYELRFLEKPGLTGWAQVKYRYSSSFTEQIEKFYYDYYYIRNRSMFLDLYIMLITVAVMVRMKGE